MKKSLILMLSLMLVMGFAVSAFAVHPSQPAESIGLIGKTTIEIGGSIRLRGDYRSDVLGPVNDEVTGNIITGTMTELGVDMDDLSEAARSIIVDSLVTKDEHRAAYDGRVRLHLNAYVSDNTMGRVHIETGNADNADTYTWGCGSERDDEGIYKEGNCKKGDLRILEAWIKHDLSGAPVGFKVGHMPLQLGRGLFLLHTRFGDDAIDVYVKPNDMLTLDFVATKFTEGDAPDADDDTDAYAAIVGLATDMVNVSGDVTFVRDKDYFDFDASGDTDGIDLWNIGVRGDVNLNAVNIYGDVEFQTGEAKDPDGDKTLNFKGWAVLAGVTANAGPVSLNVEGGMGSGLDEEEFVEELATEDEADFGMFVNALSDTQKFTYVYDYRHITAALGRNTGIANTTYVKVGAKAKPATDLSVAADVYYLKATEEVLGEDELGFELDGNVKYTIAKNLEYFIEGGILFAGSFYDNLDAEDDADDPYVVRHGIQLAF